MPLSNENELTFVGHLDELRSRLIKSFAAVFLCATVSYSFIDPFLVVIIRPVGRVIYTSPGGAFMARIILAMFGGFMIALPVVFYQVWKFIGLGLTEKERRAARVFGPLSFLCFLLGGVFAYFVMIPISLRFLLSFSSDLIIPMITVDKYIAFIGTLILACGAIFELPLVLMFLTRIGIATPEFLRQKRKYAIVLILIMSAVLTPPDVVTQLLLAMPLLLLYEVGVVLSGISAKGRDQ